MKLKYIRYTTCSGSPDKVVYASRILENGSLVVEPVGIENRQAYIDSFKDSCDINNIISRANAGDISALSARSPIYGDFTKAPKTLAEAMQLMIDSRNFFDTLPHDVKAKFDYDFNKFFVNCDKPDFLSKLGFVDKSSINVDNVKEESSIES